MHLAMNSHLKKSNRDTSDEILILSQRVPVSVLITFSARIIVRKIDNYIHIFMYVDYFVRQAEFE